VVAGGLINLSDVTTNYNYQSGARLVNSGAGSTVGVTISNSTFSQSYGVLPNAGLFITTDGAVLLNQVTATLNSGHGAFITVTNPNTSTVTVNKSDQPGQYHRQWHHSS
jgi:hypothetical protein